MAEVAVLGLGSIGSALSLRLLESRDVVVWNRSPCKAEAVAANSTSGTCTVATSPAAAIAACSSGAVIIAAFTGPDAVIDILRQEGVGKSLQQRTFVNLVSANPDEGREVASVHAEVTDSSGGFIDGAYCGNPAKARAGAGQLFLSSVEERTVDDARGVLNLLGSVSYCGKIGSSRALDYAVVDLFFVCTMSYFSNLASLQKEGVDLDQVFGEATKRLNTVPDVLKYYSNRMKSREDASYSTDVTCTLDSAVSYWAGRLPYNQAHQIPSHLTEFMVDILTQAAGGPEKPHGGADLSRLQEVVRYRPDAQDECPPSKRSKTTIV